MGYRAKGSGSTQFHLEVLGGDELSPSGLAHSEGSRRLNHGGGRSRIDPPFDGRGTRDSGDDLERPRGRSGVDIWGEAGARPGSGTELRPAPPRPALGPPSWTGSRPGETSSPVSPPSDLREEMGCSRAFPVEERGPGRRGSRPVLLPLRRWSVTLEVPSLAASQPFRGGWILVQEDLDRWTCRPAQPSGAPASPIFRSSERSMPRPWEVPEPIVHGLSRRAGRAVVPARARARPARPATPEKRGEPEISPNETGGRRQRTKLRKRESGGVTPYE